jgi:hypothetical protein
MALISPVFPLYHQLNYIERFACQTERMCLTKTCLREIM